jgi:putative tryptophan/tyrosine transport system substrate-binding protein
MRRREFIPLLGGLAAWPLAVRAQQPPKVARIGWMSRGNTTPNDPFMNAFRQGMRELGFVEGRSFVIEPRYADGKTELMPAQAAELERAGVDVIIAGPFEALQAAKQSTSRVPIIMTPSADPAVTGVVASLGRPEGNITGITEMMPELTPQRLKLLTQMVPTLSRVAILWRPGTLSQDAFGQMLNDTQATARSLGVQIQIIEAAKVDDFDDAFSAMGKERADGLIVLVNPLYAVQQIHIIERAMNHKLPAI